MASDKSKDSDRAGMVKWVVLGIVAITALFLFKGEFQRLLGRAESVEIYGVKIKTTQTLLGKAEVSNVTTKVSETLVEGIQGGTYTSRQNRFQISWPETGGWNPSETMGKTMWQQLGSPPTIDIPLFIMKNEAVGNFRPNVNVVVETIGGMSVGDYFNATIKGIQQHGWQILTRDIDEATNGGFISFYNMTPGYKLYQFQRIAVANGKGYVITASQLPPEDSISQKLKEELLSILNSFRTLQ